jgi:pimeloyl-ACP methyl ester carboxylesterase
MTTGSTEFSHTVRTEGPTLGKVFGGVHNLAAAAPVGRDTPLVVAIHGGGYHSTYFDLPGYSLLDRAAALDVPVIAVDRPNYGQSGELDVDGSIFDANAQALHDLIGELWQTYGEGSAGIVLIGHSIGAALSLLIASNAPTWPLLGVAISGCLLQEPPGTAERWASIPMKWLPCDGDMRFQLMFGPTGTYADDMPAADAAFHGDTPVLVQELIEISTGWEERLRAAALAITVPVHVRHAQYDALWISDEAQVQQFAALFANAPSVDAALWPDSGHDIDYHTSGDEFQADQLAFSLSCAARLAKAPRLSQAAGER